MEPDPDEVRDSIIETYNEKVEAARESHHETVQRADVRLQEELDLLENERQQALADVGLS